MNTGDLLNIHPIELKFSFKLREQSSCSMNLANKTNNYVAFKVKTTNPKKYCVRPNTGLVLPGGTCEVTVTMQAQKESPPDLQCKDKFLVQSVIAPDGISPKDITAEMFSREEGRVVEEFKLKVTYVPANPPSPVPEESEEGSPPRETGNEPASLASAVARSFEDSRDKTSEVIISYFFRYILFSCLWSDLFYTGRTIQTEGHAIQFVRDFTALLINGPAGGGGISSGHKKEILLEKYLVGRDSIFWHGGAKSTETTTTLTEQQTNPDQKSEIQTPTSLKITPPVCCSPHTVCC